TSSSGTSSSGGTSSSSGSTSGGTSSSSGSSSGGIADGGADGATDAGATGPSCGPGRTCMAGEVCCVAPPRMEMCSTAAACKGAALACTASSECSSGDVCCGSKLGMSGASSSCQVTCAGERLCITRMDCPTGERCILGAGGVRVCSGMTDGGGGG